MVFLSQTYCSGSAARFSMSNSVRICSLRNSQAKCSPRRCPGRCMNFLLDFLDKSSINTPSVYFTRLDKHVIQVSVQTKELLSVFNLSEFGEAVTVVDLVIFWYFATLGCLVKSIPARGMHSIQGM